MSFDELLEFLELESPAEFIYFEAMADLLECDEELEEGPVYMLMKEADREAVQQLIDDYFEDILEGLPADAGEIFSLMHQIKITLSGMAVSMENEDDVRKFTDELMRFKEWYCLESQIELKSEESGNVEYSSLRDAITTSRIEKLGGEKYRYTFEELLDYQLEGYEVMVTDLIEAGEE